MNWKPRTKNRGDLLKFTNKNREDPHPPEFHWLTQEGGNDVTERSEQQRWRDLWEARQITLSVRGVADDASNGRHDGLRDQRRRDDEVRRDGAQDRCEVRRRWTVTMNPKLGALKIRLLNNPKRELNDHCFGRFWFFSLTRWLGSELASLTESTGFASESTESTGFASESTEFTTKTSLLPSWLGKV